MPNCPGQDSRFWTADDVTELSCPACGTTIELWKDDPKRKCPKCGTLVVNPNIDLGCAQWCSFADQCVGLDGMASKGIVNALIKEIEETWNSTRVNHVRQVLKLTEQIQIVEGGDPLIIKAAALLHDCGYPQGRCRLPAAEGDRKPDDRQQSGQANPAQAQPGQVQPSQANPAQAQQILEKHELHPKAIARILELIDWRRSARDTSSLEYRILWDAECLAMIPEEVLRDDKVRQETFIAATLLTQTGLQLAAYRLKSAA